MLWVHCGCYCFVGPSSHHLELAACVVRKLGKKMRWVAGTLSSDCPVVVDGGGGEVGTR